MPYKVVNNFEDLKDEKHFYKVGDPYPRNNKKLNPARVKELSRKHPKYKRAFIEEVKEEKKTTDKPSSDK
ncbi:hypothetical protein [Halobacillus salinus]|uniref:hypothetical protein n=1 Tax=Halobacillus salinus TaxID=192814 RepID=UPI001876FFE8|nr:hypothetical protein [Halobacillus salinus]